MKSDPDLDTSILESRSLNMVQRSPLVAGVLSLLAPGVGQIYNAQIPKAVLFLVLSTAAFGFFVFGLIDTRVGGLLFALTGLAVVIAATADAAATAWKFPRIPVTWFTHWGLCLFLVVALLSLYGFCISFLKDTYYEGFKTASPSMMPTLQQGDNFLVKKYATNELNLRFGDLVVYTLPGFPETKIIKRVVGLPGDSVQLEGTTLSRNGAIIREEYAVYLKGGTTDLPLTTVAEGTVLLMGDNRDASKDSRSYVDPLVPVSNIKGKALYVYWPANLDFTRLGLTLTTEPS